MRGKNYLFLFFFVVLFLQIFQLFYFNRASFYEKYNYAYWKDRFEHSQWQLPLSSRIIGDDGLFSYVGYTLARGEDPSKINPETPPVGKYLIGFSILLFKNPVFYSLFFGFFTLLVFYFLSLKMLKDRLYAYFSTLVLFLDPLFFTQFWKSWIDSVQLFFLLLNFLLLIYLENKQKQSLVLSLFCGLSLGLFFQTKFPILFPVIFLLELFIFVKQGLSKKLVLYLLGLAIGILLPYYQYFILGYNFIDFLKLEKFITNFYLQSKLETHIGAIWQTLLFGNFPLISGLGFTKTLEWWLLWPCSFIISIFVLFSLFKLKNKYLFIKGIGIFSFLSLLIFAVIPSYPRYLLLVIPFFYILFSFFIKTYLKSSYKKIVISSVLIYGVINAYLFLLPKPDIFLNNFYYNFSNQYFRDVYEENIISKKIDMDRDKFYYISKKTMDDAKVRKIEIKELKKSIPLLSNKGFVRLKILYKTQDLGSFTQEKTIFLTKVNSQWKLNWDWNLLLNGFDKKYSVRTTIVYGKRGSIIQNGEVLAKDDIGYLILVNPDKLNLSQETEMLEFIEKLSAVVPVRLQNTYLENTLSNTFVPLVTTYRDLTIVEKEKIATFKGISLIQYPSRLYKSSNLKFSDLVNTFYPECCSRIYSSYNYHGLSGLEKKYDDILSGYSGGKIQIIDKNEKVIKTIVNKEFKNGQDVNISL